MSGRREKAKRSMVAKLMKTIAKHKAEGLTHRHAALLALSEVTGEPPQACAKFITELTKRFPHNWATGDES